jgi:hypothetical protein
MMQFHGHPLIFRKLQKCIGQTGEFFVLLSLQAGSGVSRGQQADQLMGP